MTARKKQGARDLFKKKKKNNKMAIVSFHISTNYFKNKWIKWYNYKT